MQNFIYNNYSRCAEISKEREQKYESIGEFFAPFLNIDTELVE